MYHILVDVWNTCVGLAVAMLIIVSLSYSANKVFKSSVQVSNTGESSDVRNK